MSYSGIIFKTKYNGKNKFLYTEDTVIFMVCKFPCVRLHCKELNMNIYREQSIVIPANDNFVELLKSYSPNGFRAMIAFERIIALD